MTGATPNSIVAIRFGSAGRLFYYQAIGLDLRPGDRVLVASAEGPRQAIVALGTANLEVVGLSGPFPAVLQKVEPVAITEVGIAQDGIFCDRRPCCQGWQARFQPATLDCPRQICQARFEPDRYEQMKTDLPAPGEPLCQPPATSDKKEKENDNV